MSWIKWHENTKRSSHSSRDAFKCLKFNWMIKFLLNLKRRSATFFHPRLKLLSVTLRVCVGGVCRVWLIQSVNMRSWKWTAGIFSSTIRWTDRPAEYERAAAAARPDEISHQDFSLLPLIWKCILVWPTWTSLSAPLWSELWEEGDGGGDPAEEEHLQVETLLREAGGQEEGFCFNRTAL